MDGNWDIRTTLHSSFSDMSPDAFPLDRVVVDLLVLLLVVVVLKLVLRLLLVILLLLLLLRRRRLLSSPKSVLALLVISRMFVILLIVFTNAASQFLNFVGQLFHLCLHHLLNLIAVLIRVRS